MKRLKNKLRSYIYNIPSDILIGIVLVIVSFISGIVLLITGIMTSELLALGNNIINGLFVFIIIRILWFIGITPNIGINRRLKVFRISRSVLNPKRYWIAQRTFIRFKGNECPLKELGKDKVILIQALAGNNKKLYYCYTHDEIINILKKKEFHFLKCIEDVDKSLDKVKEFLIKKADSAKCRNCPHAKSCPLLLEQKKKFYFIKFRYK